MEDIDGGLHPAVDGQSLNEDEDNGRETFFMHLLFLLWTSQGLLLLSHWYEHCKWKVCFLLSKAIYLYIFYVRYVVEENSPYARLQKKSSGGDVKGGKSWKKATPVSYADAIEESLMGLSLAGWDEDDEPSDKKRDECLTVKEMAARYPGGLLDRFVLHTHTNLGMGGGGGSYFWFPGCLDMKIRSKIIESKQLAGKIETFVILHLTVLTEWKTSSAFHVCWVWHKTVVDDHSNQQTVIDCHSNQQTVIDYHSNQQTVIDCHLP